MISFNKEKKDYLDSETHIFHISIKKYCFFIKREDGFLSFSFDKHKNYTYELAFINLNKYKKYWSDSEDELFRISFLG